MSTTDMTRKVALVTGAGSGIGRSSALELARLGASVVVLDVNGQSAAATVDAVRAAAGEAIAGVVDIAVEDSVARAVELAVTTYGRLDIAVNNAGTSARKLLHDMTVEEFERVQRINLTGTFLCMKHEIPLLRGGGAIVNVASNGGLGAIPFASAYVASKHGVVGLTKVAAVDYAREGIRVNAVCPGPTLTPGFEKWTAGTDIVAQQAAVTPVGRLAEADEVAAAVAWLASDAASYITGTALSVDGGRRA